MLNARNNESDWDLINSRKRWRVHVSGPISSRDFNSASTFVHRGHGIGLLPSTYCDEALASGALIRLLPKWESPQVPVFAVYSNRKFLPLRLNVFLKALAPWHGPPIHDLLLSGSNCAAIVSTPDGNCSFVAPITEPRVAR